MYVSLSKFVPHLFIVDFVYMPICESMHAFLIV
jgi:hypothetical protein